MAVAQFEPTCACQQHFFVTKLCFTPFTMSDNYRKRLRRLLLGQLIILLHRLQVLYMSEHICNRNRNLDTSYTAPKQTKSWQPA